MCAASKTKLFSKTLRYVINIDELYGVAKSFQSWSFYFYAHKSSQRPPVCFAQAYRRYLLIGTYFFKIGSYAATGSRVAKVAAGSADGGIISYNIVRLCVHLH